MNTKIRIPKFLNNIFSYRITHSYVLLYLYDSENNAVYKKNASISMSMSSWPPSGTWTKFLVSESNHLLRSKYDALSLDDIFSISSNPVKKEILYHIDILEETNSDKLLIRLGEVKCIS